MGEPENSLSRATIMNGGSNREGINLYSVESKEGEFWFEAELQFENDYDFWVIIRNFGLARKSAAGSTSPSNRRTFTPAEAATAQVRLEALFQGPTNQPELHYNFSNTRAKCLGVRFEPGWITIKW